MSVFECKITANLSYGPYDWCSNALDGGYCLSSNKTQSVCSYNAYSQMIHLQFDMNPALVDATTSIQVIDEKKFVAQYSMQLNGPHYEMFFQMKNPSQTYQISFRSKNEIIYEKTIQLPTLTIKGDNKMCSICLEDVNDDLKDHDHDMYVSSCQHQFHFACLWKYLQHGNHLLPCLKRCSTCKHSEKAGSFPCPICKFTLYGKMQYKDLYYHNLENSIRNSEDDESEDDE